MTGNNIPSTASATTRDIRDTSNILVGPARYGDIPSMIDIMRTYLITDIAKLFTLTPEEIAFYQKRGLFITPFEAPTGEFNSEEAVDTTFGNFTVAKELGEVLGYTVGYPLHQYIAEHPDRRDNNIHLLNQLDQGRTDRIFYGKHIGVTPDKAKARGVMRTMGDYFFDRLQRQGFTHVIGEVLAYPFENTQSLTYCQLTGHTIIGEVSYPNGTRRHLVVKKLDEKID